MVPATDLVKQVLAKVLERAQSAAAAAAAQWRSLMSVCKEVVAKKGAMAGGRQACVTLRIWGCLAQLEKRGSKTRTKIPHAENVFHFLV